MAVKEMESKWLEFKFLSTSFSGKTFTWNVVSKTKGNILGKVSWYGPWRQYAFFPVVSTIFNSGCLSDIQKFIDSKMEERKEKDNG